MLHIFPLEKFKEIKTPFYYYDTLLLNSTLDAVKTELRCYDNFFVHYAVKANANPKILDFICKADLGADCVSGGEISAALSAGFSSDKIVFAGVGKNDYEIKLGLDNDIFCFNVESVQELEVINHLAGAKNKISSVAFRINPDVGAHTHVNITTGLAENKFGIPISEIRSVIKKASDMDYINFIGLHFHIGSQILDMNDFVTLCNRINDLQNMFEAHNIIVQNINVGGGLGIDYKNPDIMAIPDFKSYFRIFARHLKLRRNQTLHFELGRSIVGQCGSLISRVLYVKEGLAKDFVILDAGMTDLIRPALYQAFHKIENLSSNMMCSTYDVVGPICESSDVFGKAVCLCKCHRGDLIAIRSAGAYGEIMASQYNCRSLPQSYFTEDFN